MIINDLDDYYIVFDTKNRNIELDTLVVWLFCWLFFQWSRIVTTKQQNNKTTKQQKLSLFSHRIHWLDVHSPESWSKSCKHTEG